MIDGPNAFAIGSDVSPLRPTYHAHVQGEPDAACTANMVLSPLRIVALIGGTTMSGLAQATNVNAFGIVAADPFGLTTVTSTVPGACGGVVAVIATGARYVVPALLSSKNAIAPGSNPCPVMVTVVPPAVLPDAGAMPVAANV